MWQNCDIFYVGNNFGCDEAQNRTSIPIGGVLSLERSAEKNIRPIFIALDSGFIRSVLEHCDPVRWFRRSKNRWSWKEGSQSILGSNCPFESSKEHTCVWEAVLDKFLKRWKAGEGRAAKLMERIQKTFTWHSKSRTRRSMHWHYVRLEIPEHIKPLDVVFYLTGLRESRHKHGKVGSMFWKTGHNAQRTSDISFSKFRRKKKELMWKRRLQLLVEVLYSHLAAQARDDCDVKSLAAQDFMRAL